MKKIIVAGGRDFNDYWYLNLKVGEVLASDECYFYGMAGDHARYDDVEIVSGGARGADFLGERFAEENFIPLKKFPADWDAHGRAAGIIRNEEMARYADMLIAFLSDPPSKGTSNMIKQAISGGLEVHIFRYDKK